MPTLKYNRANAELVHKPPCPNCGAEMLLARLDPAGEAHDRRTFECTKCDHTEVVTVKYN